MAPTALLALLALSGTHHRDRVSTQQRQLEESLDEDHYVEHRFKQKVSKALASAQKVLSTARNPTFAEDQPHSYDDKYALAEHLTSVSIAAQLNVLESIGLTAPMLEQGRQWAADGKAVTLRLSSTERTSFLREATSDIPRSTVVKSWLLWVRKNRNTKNKSFIPKKHQNKMVILQDEDGKYEINQDIYDEIRRIQT